MNKISLFISGLALACVPLLPVISGCSSDHISGGGTEGGNTVCGVLVNDDITAAENATVYLLPSDYNPGIDDLKTSAYITTTDDSGNYTFNHTVEGNYSIQAEDTESGKRTLITGIKVSEEDIAIPVDTLREPGTIRIALPETIDNTTGYLYIPGTTILATVSDISDLLIINDVPAKLLPPICFAGQSDSTWNVLRYNVQVYSNDTVAVTNTQWQYTRKLFLNTTASGAGVDENVADFPVVVRLTSNNFDFSHTRTDGGDIRFIRADSIPLAHEIERWDISINQAEIWVRVDTIYGNDSSQFIMMYWGNSEASDNSGSSPVFDTSAGFQGVWHLGGTSDSVFDATPNRFHGLRNGTISATSGIVGSGLHFQDSGAFIDMGNVLNTGSSDLTISAWVKRSTTGLHTIMAKSDGGDPNSGYGWTLSFHTADQLHFFAASGGTSWGSSGAFDCWSDEKTPMVDTTEWHFVAAVFDRSDKNECRLYIDGFAFTGGSNGDISNVSTLVNTASFRIGAEADGDYRWTGFIDECVIAHSIRNESWIRLCYSNQGPEDLLIQFK